MREGKAAAAREALAAAKDVATGVSAREAGHIRFFDLAFSGRTDAAIDFLRPSCGLAARCVDGSDGHESNVSSVARAASDRSSGSRQQQRTATPSRSTSTVADRSRRLRRASLLWRSELAGHPRDNHLIRSGLGN